GPIMGQWDRLSQYFDGVHAGEYASPMTPDDFHGDYLSERVKCASQNHDETDVGGTGVPPVQDRRDAGPTIHNETRSKISTRPVSAFADHVRLRRRLDTCWSLAAMQRGLAGANDPQHAELQIAAVENEIEATAPESPAAECLQKLAG